MPTNAELEFALMMMQFATMLLTLPPSTHITASIAQVFYVVSLHHQERRSRQHVGYLGRPVLSDPHESAAMRIVKHGDDRAFKKFFALSRGLFELVLGDIGPLLCRRGPGTRGRPCSLDSAMVVELELEGKESSSRKPPILTEEN